MRVVITGAAGFVASGVADAIAQDLNCFGTPITDLVLSDLNMGTASGRWITGDLSHPSHIKALLADPVDVFLHLASVPGRMAEKHPEIGRAVNLTAPLALLDGLARQSHDCGVTARVVFASSIAVLGALGPEIVDETYPVAPLGCYGTHKHKIEGRIANLSHQNEVDGVSLRLPGIIARPPNAAGFGSAFMSDLFHHAAAGNPYSCPVSQDATAWWMSRKIAITNILHGARMDTRKLGPERMVPLPALFASIADLMTGLSDHYGADRVSQFNFEPDSVTEAMFGRFPKINNTTALGLGFAQDTDVATLIGFAGVLQSAR